MATGTGKTRTILGMIYRFLKSGFRRILFLIDKNLLGEQAQDFFHDVKLEDLMSLEQIYKSRKFLMKSWTLSRSSEVKSKPEVSKWAESLISVIFVEWEWQS